MVGASGDHLGLPARPESTALEGGAAVVPGASIYMLGGLGGARC